MISENYSLGDLINSIEKSLEYIEIKLNILRRMLNTTIAKNKKILKSLKKSNINMFYNSINKEFGYFHEELVSFFDNKINIDIKDQLTKITKDFKNYINSLEQNESLYSNDDEKQLSSESSELYENVNNLADEILKNNPYEISGFEIERNNYPKLFYYVINFFSESKINFDTKGNNLIGQITDALYENIKSLVITEGNKIDYMHHSIRSDKFNFEADNILNKIKDITNLKNVIKNIVGKENFDYRGNSMIFNSSQNIERGTEKYDPPHGWTGIGIKAFGKYEDDNWLNLKNKFSEWANAYIPIDSIESFKKILEEGLKPGKFQGKQCKNDIRNSGKKVGKGNYSYPEIKTAEEKANGIIINGKKYKFIIMARVKISKIREPEDVKYWVLDKEYIRIYRLLFKEA